MGGPAGSLGVPASAKLAGTVTDVGDGTYTLEYTALPGEWVLEVRVEGACVSPTPCSICNVIDPAEEEERQAREAAERRRQEVEARAAEEASRAAEAAEAEAQRDELRRKIEGELRKAAIKADEREQRAAEAAARRAAMEEERRRRIMAALKREEETRRRAEAALAEVQAEKERQLAEALQRKVQFSKRTGGGFVVQFKPSPEEREEAQAPPRGGATAWGEGAGGAAHAARRKDLAEKVDDT